MYLQMSNQIGGVETINSTAAPWDTPDAYIALGCFAFLFFESKKIPHGRHSAMLMDRRR